MTAIDIMSEAKSVGFQHRVKYFMQKAAIAIMAEIDTTPNHTARVVYSGRILTGLASVLEYAIAVATNATIAAGPLAATDNDIEFAVNSMIDAFALSGA